MEWESLGEQGGLWLNAAGIALPLSISKGAEKENPAYAQEEGRRDPHTLASALLPSHSTALSSYGAHGTCHGCHTLDTPLD